MEEKEIKKQQLQWLLDNIDNIEIDGIYHDEMDGHPIMLIDLKDFNLIEKAGFKIKNLCVLLE